MKPIFIFASLFVLASCGGSEKEKTSLLQAQKARDDSNRLADIQRLKDAQLERSALGDSLTAYTALLVRQQKTLSQLRTAIYTANEELTQLKQSYSGRMPRDRETQVNNQEMKIQALVVQQITLQSEFEHNQSQIAQIKSKLSTASR